MMIVPAGNEDETWHDQRPSHPVDVRSELKDRAREAWALHDMAVDLYERDVVDMETVEGREQVAVEADKLLFRSYDECVCKPDDVMVCAYCQEHLRGLVVEPDDPGALPFEV